MSDFDFRHNHYTRDVRPHDCPACRIEQLEANVAELEQVAESWQKDYQALKDKYEPETFSESQAVPDAGPAKEFARYDSPRRVTAMSMEDMLKRHGMPDDRAIRIAKKLSEMFFEKK